MVPCHQPDEGAAGWQLTEEGMQRLSLHHTLVKPGVALEPRADQAFNNLSVWELSCALAAQGRAIRKAPTSRSRRRPPLQPYALRGENVYFVNSPDVNRLRGYMLGLAQADQWLQAQVVVEIHHCRGNAYCAQHLQGKADGRVQPHHGLPALEPGDEGHGAAGHGAADDAGSAMALQDDTNMEADKLNSHGNDDMAEALAEAILGDKNRTGDFAGSFVSEEEPTGVVRGAHDVSNQAPYQTASTR